LPGVFALNYDQLKDLKKKLIYATGNTITIKDICWIWTQIDNEWTDVRAKIGSKDKVSLGVPRLVSIVASLTIGISHRESYRNITKISAIDSLAVKKRSNIIS